MFIYIHCEKCFRLFNEGKIKVSDVKFATGKHHLFPNTKSNRKLYGKLLDDPKNLKPRCDKHHTQFEHPEHLNEIEFCQLLDIEPRSKTEAGRRLGRART